MSEAGRPGRDEYPPNFDGYVGLVPSDDVIGVLDEQRAIVHATLAALPEARASHRYADGKWSVREVVGHVIDCERVFGYRALAFARGERAPLPQFDENEYARQAGHDSIPIRALVEEFGNLRASHVAMLRHLPADAWARAGTASGKLVTVRALAFIIAGHAAHHLKLLHERYGVPHASGVG